MSRWWYGDGSGDICNKNGDFLYTVWPSGSSCYKSNNFGTDVKRAELQSMVVIVAVFVV